MKLQALACLSLLVTACHRRARRSTATVPVMWRMTPVDGPALRIAEGLVVRGAVRIENGAVAAPPYPATALAASARLDDGSWRFISEDGTLYRADAPTAPLGVLRGLPFRAAPVRAHERVATQGIHSVGALAVLDDAHHAWAVLPDGSAREMLPTRALSACFASRDEALVVIEPGVLQVSHDGGETFTALRAPAGIPIAVWNADGRTLVRTTAGTLRYEHGVLVPDVDALTPTAWLRPSAEVDGRFRDAFATAPFPLLTGRAVAVSPTRIATLQGDALVMLDARSGQERARETLPGSACTLARGGGGLRVVCTHQAWARFVAARDGDGGWRVLRDELRAEPVHQTVFDDASAAWAVQSPCVQRTVPDPRDVCLYDVRGATHTLTLPAQGDLVAMLRGVALAVEAAVSDRAPRLFALHDDSVRSIALPDDARQVASLHSGDGGLSLLYADSAGALTRATARTLDDAWRTEPLPSAFRRGVHRDDGALLAWGADASALAWWPRHGVFTPLAAPVAGRATALSLDLDASTTCAGSWCRIGGVLTLTPSRAYAGGLVTRDDDAPHEAAPPGPQPTLRCTAGTSRPAADLDHGVAASGYLVRATLAATTLTVTWEGAVRATTTRPVPARTGARAFVRGVQGARDAAALVELCAPSGCDHLLALRSGFVMLGLGRATPGGVEAQEQPAGYVVRADDRRDGVDLVTLVRVDTAGAITARRTLALVDGTDHAHVGSWDGHDGLWIDDLRGALRFVSMEPGDADIRVPAPRADTRGCAADVHARGEVRMLQHVPQVSGRGWFVEAGEWQTEQVLAVDEGRVCVRAITAGEARDEAEARASGHDEETAVRSVVLRAAADGNLTGDAWSAGRAVMQRCVWD